MKLRLFCVLVILGAFLMGCPNPTDTTSDDHTPDDQAAAGGLTVTFYLNYDGQVLSSANVAEGGMVNRPSAPERSSYCFCGWYTEADCTNKYDFGTSVTSNLSLYGRWIDTNDPRIPTYRIDDGSMATITGYSGAGGAIIIPTNIDGYPVTSIEGLAGTTTLTAIEICHGLASIAYGVFKGCTELTSISIPDSVTSIMMNAFRGCAKLDSIAFPEGLTDIGNYSFQDCGKIASITLPDSITSIGDYAFDSCDSMTSLVFSGGSFSIGAHAFYACSGLTALVLPTGVKSINSSAFRLCTGLTSITCMAVTPPSIGYNVFADTNDTPIRVPADSLEDYKTAEIWRTYSTRMLGI